MTPPAHTACEERATFLSLSDTTLIESILPHLNVCELYALGRCNKRLYEVSRDNGFWRAKLQEDYGPHVPPALLLHRSFAADEGWFRRVYLGLRRPQVYILGRHTRRWDVVEPGTDTMHHQARTHVQNVSSYFPATATEDVWLYPTIRPGKFFGWVKGPLGQEEAVRVTYADYSMRPPPERRPVQLQAAGENLVVLDSQGSLFGWGNLTEVKQDGYPSMITIGPTTTLYATSRHYMISVDDRFQVWEQHPILGLVCHAALHLRSRDLACFPDIPHAIQVAAGWDHSACLVSDDTIHIWWPFSAAYLHACRPTWVYGYTPDGTIVETVRPSAITTLPPIPTPIPTPVAKIACGAGFVLALLANGDVWYIRVAQVHHGQWEYLEHYSSPTTTNIVANCHDIATYATPTPRVPPGWHKIRPRFGRIDAFDLDGASFRPYPLQNFGFHPIAKMALGDWHYAALDVNGVVWEWGTAPEGDGPEQGMVPQPVKLPSFVYDIACGNRHTVAFALGDSRIFPLDARVPLVRRRTESKAHRHSIVIEGETSVLKRFPWEKRGRSGDDCGVTVEEDAELGDWVLVPEWDWKGTYLNHPLPPLPRRPSAFQRTRTAVRKLFRL